MSENLDMNSELLWVIVVFGGLLIGLIAFNLSKYIGRFIPYSIMLIIIGYAIGGIEFAINKENSTFNYSIMQFDPHLFLQLFLPNLIFYSVFSINYHCISRVRNQALVLAIPGVLINAALTSIIFLFIIINKFSFIQSFIFGTIISATDPVAVVALLREIKASENLATLIEAESLFNDASAIVGFTLLLQILTDVEKLNKATDYILRTVLLLTGPLIGVVIGGILLLWIYFVRNDEIMETTITFVGANITFLVAENVKSSGILATVSLGLLMAKYKANFSHKSLENLEHFWELLEYFGKTLIFLISGIFISIKTLSVKSISWWDILDLLIIYIGITITRALTLLVLHPVLKKLRNHYDYKTAIVLWYGSLRGAIGLALALIISNNSNIDQNFKDKIAFHVSGIVIMTLLINGTTIQYILKLLNIKGFLYQSDFLIRTSLEHLKNESDKFVGILMQNNHFSGANWDNIKSKLPDYMKLLKTEEYLDQIHSKSENIRYRFICSMKSYYWKQHNDNMISTHAYNILNDAAEQALDQNNILVQWEVIQKHFKIPKTIHYLSGIKFLRSIVYSFLYDRLYLAVQLATAFIFSCDRMGIIVNNFPEWKIPELSQIELEVRESVSKARSGLNNIQKVYFDVYQAIQTRNANAFILNRDIQNIHRLKKDGIIQYSECEEMTQKIKKLQRLIKITRPHDKGEAYSTFKNLPFVSVLDEEFITQIFSKTNYKIFREGDTLYSIDSKKKRGVFVIVNGLVELKTPTGQKKVVGAGSILNLWATISKNQSITNCKAVTNLSVITLSNHVLLEFFKNKQCKEIIWKCAGFMIFRMYFMQKFCLDELRIGEICLMSTFQYCSGTLILYSPALLLRGRAKFEGKYLVAPSMIEVESNILLKGVKREEDPPEQIERHVEFLDALVLIFDGQGNRACGNLQNFVEGAMIKTESFNKQESLGLIYVKGSAESNRIKMAGSAFFQRKNSADSL